MKTLVLPLLPRPATIFVLATLLCAHAASAAPTKVEAKAVARTKAAPKTNAPVEIQDSVFTIPTTQNEGRDPFFPTSIWIYNQNPTASKATNKVVATVALVVNGFSGTAEKPLVIINGQTFEKGEERTIATGSGRQKVHCIEIRADIFAVIVEVNGETRELRMRK